ncbi:MAG TPA: nucleoside deaminase [Desulfobulbus sp.]|nr:nucleoside deaminase [Desulfobulbus sp.]
MAGKNSSFMAEAVRLSEHGMRLGDGGPFGAVIVRKGRIIGTGWNRVLATNDPTAHAEITAIRDACRAVSSYRLEGCTIYVNCEPCPMCLAAIYWAGIEKVVFAATREDAGQIGFIDAKLYREICLPDKQRTMKIKREDTSAALKIMAQWPTLDGRRDY